MTIAQLDMELSAKVVPAARELVESLRVANLLTREDVAREDAEELDRIHGEALGVADAIMHFRQKVVSNR